MPSLSAAASGGAAAYAFEAGAVAHQGELLACGAGIALITLGPGFPHG